MDQLENKAPKQSRKAKLKMRVLIGVVAAVVLGVVVWGMFWGAGSSEKDVIVENLYVDLHYPGKWEDKVKTEVMTTDANQTVVFYGKLAGEQVPLFALKFAETSDNTTCIGQIRIAENTFLTVSLESYDISNYGTWTAEEMDQLCAMQEDANYVIAQLKTSPEFVAAN